MDVTVSCRSLQIGDTYGTCMELVMNTHVVNAAAYFRGYGRRYLRRHQYEDNNGTGDGNRTRTPLRAQDFKSWASTNSATPARVLEISTRRGARKTENGNWKMDDRREARDKGRGKRITNDEQLTTNNDSQNILRFVYIEGEGMSSAGRRC